MGLEKGLRVPQKLNSQRPPGSHLVGYAIVLSDHVIEATALPLMIWLWKMLSIEGCWLTSLAVPSSHPHSSILLLAPLS